MGKVINLLFVISILVTVLHGLPQYQRESGGTPRQSEQSSTPDHSGLYSGYRDQLHKGTSTVPPSDINRQNRPQGTDSRISSLPQSVDFKKKDIVPPNEQQNRRTRDTNDDSKPLDSHVTDSRISSLPQSVDFKKKDTVPPNDQNRGTRDTNEDSKPHDSIDSHATDSGISPLPQSVDFKKKDTIPQNDDNRRTRDTDEKQPKPSDRPQISTLPASVNFKKEDTLSKDKDQVRRARDTGDESGEDSSEKHGSNSSQSSNEKSSSEESKEHSDESKERKRRDLKEPPHGVPAQAKPPAPPHPHQTKDVPRPAKHHSGEAHNPHGIESEHVDHHPRKP